MVTFILFLIAIILIVFNVNAVKKENSGSFTAILKERQDNINEYDIKLGEIRKEYAENITEVQKEIEESYWIFDSEQTIIFYAKAVDENGKYNKQIGTCYFIRTKSGGWFGVCSNMFWWCELDVDNRWYNELIKENAN